MQAGEEMGGGGDALIDGGELLFDVIEGAEVAAAIGVDEVEGGAGSVEIPFIASGEEEEDGGVVGGGGDFFGEREEGGGAGGLRSARGAGEDLRSAVVAGLEDDVFAGVELAGEETEEIVEALHLPVDLHVDGQRGEGGGFDAGDGGGVVAVEAGDGEGEVGGFVEEIGGGGFYVAEEEDGAGAKRGGGLPGEGVGVDIEGDEAVGEVLAAEVFEGSFVDVDEGGEGARGVSGARAAGWLPEGSSGARGTGVPVLSRAAHFSSTGSVMRKDWRRMVWWVKRASSVAR